MSGAETQTQAPVFDEQGRLVSGECSGAAGAAIAQFRKAAIARRNLARELARIELFLARVPKHEMSAYVDATTKIEAFTDERIAADAARMRSTR
jgi:hypothetical protein